MRKLLSLSLSLFVLGAVSSLSANQFGIQIALTQGNYSNGDPLTSHLEFEIGAFSSGFTPTASNVDQWEANWITTGIYLGDDFAFRNYGDPEHPDAGDAMGEAVVRPGAPEGKTVYLWGFTSKDTSGVAEWILIEFPATFPEGTDYDELFLPGDTLTSIDSGVTLIYGTAFNHPAYPDWEDFDLRTFQTASAGQVPMSSGEFPPDSGDGGTESFSGGTMAGMEEGFSDAGIPAAGGTGHAGESTLLAFMRWIHSSGVPVTRTGFGHRPTGDVFTNIQKYALGFDPTANYPASLQKQFATDWEYNNDTHPGIRFLHNKAVTSVDYVFQRSTDLNEWEAVPNDHLLSTESYTGTGELPSGADNPDPNDLEWLTVIDLDPPVADRTFYRIKYEPHSWKTFYVSLSGTDDNNDGSEPFRTIDAARQHVQTLLSGQQGDITVLVRGGTYFLEETLAFDEDDSGQGEHRVIYAGYPGEFPVISGGRPIPSLDHPDPENAWEVYDSEEGIFRISLQDTGLGNFRQLYVDGERAQRARISPVPGAKFGRISGWDDDNHKINVPESHVAPLNTVSNLQEVEMVMGRQWNQRRYRIEEYDSSGSTRGILPGTPERWVEFIYPSGSEVPDRHRPEWGEEREPYYWENAYEFITENGEWYLEFNDSDPQTSFVYYKSDSANGMLGIEVIAPKLEDVLQVQGESHENRVQNITFFGLQFMHSNWVVPSEDGYMGVQSGRRHVWNGPVPPPPDHQPSSLDATGARTPAGIVIENSTAIRFERNLIRHFGGVGIDLHQNTEDTWLLGNVIADIACNGISIHGDEETYDPEPQDPEKDPVFMSVNDMISNNYVTRVAQDYTGGSGIWSSFSQNLVIEHNEIFDTPYTGISIGFMWHEVDTGTTGTRVRGNRIHQVVSVHPDGGAIYSLGWQSTSLVGDLDPSKNRAIVEENYISCLAPGPWPTTFRPAVLYFDQQSRDIVMRNNVFSDIDIPAVRAIHKNAISSGVSHPNNSCPSWESGVNETCDTYCIEPFDGKDTEFVVVFSGLKDEYLNIRDLIPISSPTCVPFEPECK